MFLLISVGDLPFAEQKQRRNGLGIGGAEGQWGVRSWGRLEGEEGGGKTMLWPVILKLTACILNVNQGFKTDRGEEDTAMDKEQLERDGFGKPS